MRKVLKAALILMTVFSVLYASAIVFAYAVANGNDLDSNRYVVYAADRYQGDVPLTKWYTPEQLGIDHVIDYKESNSWLQIAVDRRREPFPLQKETPVFLYKDRFYHVSPLWATPGAPEGSGWQIPIGAILGAGWISGGGVFFKWRGKE